MVTNLARLTRAVFPRWGSRAWLVAGGYASFAAIWIYTSDSALALLSPDLVVRVSVYKGLAFVATTSLLLLLALGRIVDALEASNASLLVSEAELARAQRLTAALMHVNQAIARTPAEGELLEKICRILVEHGGFELVVIVAWVGGRRARS